jgi:biofilm protein TabA
MIFCKLEQAAMQIPALPRLQKAINWLKEATDKNNVETIFKSLAPGERKTIYIENEDIYALLMRYETRHHTEAKMEAHQKYIDIQYLFDGREMMLLADMDAVREKVPYNPEKDVTLFHLPEATHNIILTPGSLAVLWPTDVHAPNLAAGDKTTVDKIVLKVRLD